MQQPNDGNEGHNIRGATGVFYGGSDRSIGYNLSFLDSTAPIQGVNDVDITVSTTELQYNASLDASSVRKDAQTSMYFLGALLYA